MTRHRSNIDLKAKRLLDEDRVEELSGARVFHVRGDHDSYLVTARLVYDRFIATCSCPAPAGCSHVRAVERIFHGETIAAREADLDVFRGLTEADAR